MWLSDGTIDVSHITPSFRHVEEGWASSCTKCQLQSLIRPNMRPNFCCVQLHRVLCCMLHPPTSRRNNRMALTEAYTPRCMLAPGLRRTVAVQTRALCPLLLLFVRLPFSGWRLQGSYRSTLPHLVCSYVRRRHGTLQSRAIPRTTPDRCMSRRKHMQKAYVK